ncbi:RecT family recombinase [Pectobacterium aroidearum]|uniref:RecT family recombinase n=1 Tax=Pectobacterium aroidearum TaxID=1201031 RepID=UPI001CD33376|nr:RecT family recombinase [Pectobacterium aroidearum]
MSNQVSTISQSAGTAATIFSPDALNQLVKFAEVMANGRVAVPSHLAGKPSDCLAVTMQAAQWGMNPFAVAQKTHVINGVLGYEAQLVNAVLTSLSPTKDRLNYEWFGDWSKVIGNFVEKTSQKGNKYIAPGWSLSDEKGLGVRVWATMKSESQPRVLELMLTQAQVRNSTLWASDPKQQLAYLAAKRWVRLHAPDVLLGVYTPDELEEMPRVERDITPPAGSTRADLNAAINAPIDPEPTQQHTKPERTQDDILASFTEAASNAKSIEELNLVFNGGKHPDGKTRKGAKDVLTEKWLEMAEDVYQIRHEEINDIPM